MVYKAKQYDIASFELIGYRREDGKLQIGDDETNIQSCFPEKVEVCGSIYTLERVDQNIGPTFSKPGTKPRVLEWGIYV